MLDFHEITINEKKLFKELIELEDSRSADYSFANIWMWDSKYKQLFSTFDKRLIIKLKYKNHPFFAFPIGSGPLAPVIAAMKEYADANHWTLIISGITQENMIKLDKELPNQFVFNEEIDFNDYIYRVDSLSSFTGKKLHSKKNHCNRFEREHVNWSFIPLTEDLIPNCIDMLNIWTSKNIERLQDGIIDEHTAIMRGFKSFKDLELNGGVLIVDDNIIGFSIGEIISTDTIDVHFEKAFTEINGAYAMVCREYAKYVKLNYPTITFLNREDDMGITSLRKSKISYQPEYLLKKYTARYVGK